MHPNVHHRFGLHRRRSASQSLIGTAPDAFDMIAKSARIVQRSVLILAQQSRQCGKSILFYVFGIIALGQKGQVTFGR